MARLIDYNSVIGQIQKLHMDAFRRLDKVSSSAYQKAWDILMDAPTVDAVEVVHGRWEEGYVIHKYGCSCCGARQDVSSPYCPNCGAEMDGVADA